MKNADEILCGWNSQFPRAKSNIHAKKGRGLFLFMSAIRADPKYEHNISVYLKFSHLDAKE